jgi:hypothetical protein
VVNILDQTVCNVQTTVDAWQAGFWLFHELTSVRLVPTSSVRLSCPSHIPAPSAKC